jgi:uncharacterized membrane protein
LSHLENAQRFFAEGDFRRSVKALERARSQALVMLDAGALERVLTLAEAVAAQAPSTRADRLIHAATQNLRYVHRTSGAPETKTPTAPSQTQLDRALSAVDFAARTLEQQVRDAITLARAAAAAPAPVQAPLTAPAPAQPKLTPPPPRPVPPKPAAPPKPPREIDWSIFLGARALAWAGGLVMILGIVFFFVLAANRGWLTPEIRVALGGGTSIAVFGAGLWLKRRFGRLYSALAAVSAGIAGAYATLLAATALYDFVPQLWALVAAAGIAAIGVAVSLAWSAQTVAGLGLIGAMLVPLMVVFDEGELSFVGTSFVAIIFAGAAVVAHAKRWRDLLLAAGGASLPQIAVLVAEAHALEWRMVGLSGVFWLLYLGAGIAWQFRFGARGVEAVAGTLVIAGGALATYACAYLLSGTTYGVHREGLGLLIVAAVYGLLALVFFRRASARDLTSLLWAVAATLAAIAGGELFTGPSLTAVWGAVAVLLAWLSVRTGEERLFLPAFGYLVLALGYVLAIEAPPMDLFEASRHPAGGTPSVVAAAASLSLFAWYCRPRAETEEVGGPVGRLLLLGVGWIRRLGGAYVWLAGLFALYAASLAVLELFVTVADFDWGHVGLAGLWAAVALGLVEWGVRRSRPDIEVGAFALLAFAVGEALTFDLDRLAQTEWALSFLTLAAGALLVGFEFGRLASLRGRLLPAATAIVTSACLAAAAVVALAHGDWHGIVAEGGALVGLALLYATFATPVFRSQRDLSTLLWSLALALAIAGGAELLAGRWLVLAGALLCAGLALLARFGREARLQAAAVPVFALSLAYALWAEAPPRELFVAVAHPGAGVPALLFLAAAAGVFASLASRTERAAASWVGATLVLYAGSLAVLELFVTVADFDWGHVGLAGLWAACALGLAEVGVRQVRADLQLGGFALLGLTLAEVLGFDAIELPRTIWSLSFLTLAAGALLVGFEFGRLASLRGRLLPAATAIVTSACLAAAAVVALAHGDWHGIVAEGGALVGLALLYATFATPVFRSQRDLSTLLWSLALALAIAGGAELLAGRWLVLAGALLCAGLALLARFGREARLQAAAVPVFALSLAYALWAEAPPRELFVAVAHPGAGVPALLFLAAAAGVAAYGPELRRHARPVALAVVGVLTFYAISLSILEIAEIATDADIDTKFQRGHTGVSVFWGLISLGFLYVGLTRRSRALRLAGFGLFGVTLAKIFLYDLAFLSSLTRALSFIAVGAVLLFAGFFYQRLSEQLEERDRAGSPETPPGNAAA